MEPGADARSRRRTSLRGREEAGRGAERGAGSDRRRPLTTRRALAPAKVNLFLHVGPTGADSYHPLVSLVAFADVGDEVSVSPADQLSLTVTGPFAGALAGQGDNLVLTALHALGQAAGIGEPALAVVLDKRLPIAAGLGGGSSDAAAALRLADAALGLDLGEARLAEIARVVGADGPMCLLARSAWAEGIGDRLTLEPALPPLHAVLANPGRPSPTGAVYRAYDACPEGAADRPSPPPAWTPDAVIDWLADRRNDLQSPAVALEPAIATALAAMEGAGARLTRMSGSGATVFGLFENAQAAITAAAVLRRNHEDWWVAATRLGDASSAAPE
jgi:4-diphosphocytidyl-2-C-methyl-D-erythritol kinase